jgi:carbamate kinase
MNERKLAVVAVGGNSLIIDKDHKSIPDQYEAACRTTAHVVNMIEEGWQVVLTHGNGPQVGFVLRRSELAMHEVPVVPMDYAGADIMGAVGYMFQKAFDNEFRHRGITMPAVTVVTQVVVDHEDPAFANPTKPIGSHMEEARAREIAAAQGWEIREDAGRGWRRVVPSPIPREIVELDAIRTLLGHGYVVVACGGGGIPVVRESSGDIVGVEAVIDKDLASSLLARKLGADALIVSTGVEKVAINFNKPDQKWLDRLTLSEAKRFLDEGHFLAGSMGPKIKAMIEFLENGGEHGIITSPQNLGRAVRGEAGTHLTR